MLVVVYLLLYYRGLGLVAIGSLLVAAALTYALALLLGQGVGFTLTLPGIAGLIVAIGITADSFIVFFERLRDEVREGKSLRLAVESGWIRARATILAADAVSILAALILFIFAIGVVRGFAFALGLVTLIDVLVVFCFTKPLVSVLARTKFFGQGHRLSGLDAAHLGITRPQGHRDRPFHARPPVPLERATPDGTHQHLRPAPVLRARLVRLRRTAQALVLHLCGDRRALRGRLRRARRSTWASSSRAASSSPRRSRRPTPPPSTT